MDAHKITENDGKRALTLVKWLSDHAIDGVRPLSSAQDLATEYLRDQSYKRNGARVVASAVRGFKDFLRSRNLTA